MHSKSLSLLHVILATVLYAPSHPWFVTDAESEAQHSTAIWPGARLWLMVDPKFKNKV